MFHFLKYSALAIGLTFSALTSYAHEVESRVALEPESLEAVQAGHVKYSFQMVDTKSNKVLGENDLLIDNEKILHMIVYDPSLKEFQHVHPTFDGKLWSVDLSFSVNGNYWVWAQGKLAEDEEEFSASNRITVQGGQSAWPTPPTLTDVRVGSDGSSVAEIGKNKLQANQMVMLMVNFKRNDGTQPDITPYLGAFAHVVIVPEDGDSIIHAHPMAGGSPSQGMLHITFPTAGFYRLWIQFMDAGELKVVPLSVKVF